MYRSLRWGTAFLVVALALLIPVGVFAHAHLTLSIPTRDGTVSAAPLNEVRLRFSEAVETQSSMFKVYRLETDGVEDLNAAARDLVSKVIRLRNDQAQRADDGLVTTARTSPEIVIRMKPDLEPGTYVVMWRVLSIDTHTTEGFFVFHYEPEA